MSGQTITTNIDSNPFDKPSDEILSKLPQENRNKIIELSSRAKVERDKAIRLLKEDAARSKEISAEDLKERQRLVDEEIKELYSKQVPMPAIQPGKNGTIVSKHKNKLAFIFIGDVKKAEEDTKNTINAPKISMVVGGGLESAYRPDNEEIVSIDPREERIVGVSAELHLISLSDIDTKGILLASSLTNRSAVKATADVLELSAKEVVLIRSLGEAYGSKGHRVMTPGGVHIVSGINNGEQLITEPEPMVLGKKLNDVIIEIVNKISEMNSTIISMNKDMLTLKSSLITHIHPIAPIPGPPFLVAAPSPVLATTIAPTIVSNTVLNITNCYSNLVNLELLKANKLTALSKENFLSDYNRVN